MNWGTAHVPAWRARLHALLGQQPDWYAQHQHGTSHALGCRACPMVMQWPGGGLEAQPALGQWAGSEPGLIVSAGTAAACHPNMHPCPP